MAARAGRPAIYRFDVFEADSRTSELRKHGRRLRLPPLPFEVLLALLETPGELVTREVLQRRLWPDGTFVDFDSNLNAAVTRLRQTLGDAPDHPKFIETLPRLGYRFVAAVETGPTAQPAAPAVEPVPVGTPAPPASGRAHVPSRAAIVTIVGCLAIAGLVSWRVSRPDPGSLAPVRLVVLPFQNLTGEAGHDYLVDGVTEELITALARVDPSRLGIIARTTAFQYRASKKTVAEIAQELRVDFVVEGSVRRDAERVTVSAQVVEPVRQTQIWAERYDGSIQDLPILERDIASAVAASVQVLASPRAGAPHADLAVPPQAREAYLRARHFAAQGTVPAILKAIEFYAAAIEHEPRYALAHAGLARALIFATQPAPAIALQRAGEAAARARDLAPNLPEAQLAWALVTLYRDRDLSGGDREFQRALVLDSGNAEAHFYYSQCLTAAGRFDDALAEARRAQELDPSSTLIHHYIGRILHFARRSDEAAAHLRRTLELDPNYAWAHLFLAVSEEQRGNFDAAVAARQRYWAVMNVPPERVSRLRERYAAEGYGGVRREWIAWIEGFARASGFVTSTELAMLHAAEGDTDAAFYWLSRAVDHHTRDLVYLRVYPELDHLRADPRFAAIAARVFPGQS